MKYIIVFLLAAENCYKLLYRYIVGIISVLFMTLYIFYFFCRQILSVCVCVCVQRKSKSAGVGETVPPKLSSVPGLVIKAERAELQICSPMYAKSMAKACSLLSSATEHILYHCHYHFNIQVCSALENKCVYF